MSLSQTTTQDEQNKAVIALAEGFDTLIELIQKLVWQERELSNRLQFAYDEVSVSSFLFVLHSLCLFLALHDERTLISSRSEATSLRQ